MVRYRDRNYFAHIIQHDYVFHPDEWQFEAKPVQQSTKRKNKLMDSCWFDFTCHGSSIRRNDQRRFIQTFIAKYGRLWRPMNITIILNNEIP